MRAVEALANSPATTMLYVRDSHMLNISNCVFDGNSFKEAREAAENYNANYEKRLECIRMLVANLR
jgi:hypothetical protein